MKIVKYKDQKKKFLMIVYVFQEKVKPRQIRSCDRNMIDIFGQVFFHKNTSSFSFQY